MTAKVSKKNSFSTLSYQVLWLGSGIRPPRTIPLGPRFFDCYRDYASCLGDDYIHPNLKGEVFTYISSMKSLPNKVRRNLGSGDWQFTNKEYWSLKSDYLLPLKSFILSSIQDNKLNTRKKNTIINVLGETQQ